jgi:hypothetical protein
MAQDCRLVKMTAFSSSVESSPKVEWLMQVDLRAQTILHENYHEIMLGDSRMDLYPLLPSQRTATWNLHSIKKPVEPFTFQQTRRLVLEPAIQGETTCLLNVIHVRKETEPRLEEVEASIHNGKISAHWVHQSKGSTLSWDLLQKTVQVAPPR